MKRHWALPALLVALVGLASAVTAQAEPMFPYPYTQTVLDNGLTVVLVPMESPGMVAYYSIVRTGSRDEYEPGHSGFAHFFEHMMFRGTKKYPGDVYDKLMTEMGADANAFTSDDVTCYHIEFAAEDLELVMELESDRFQNLSYAEPAFKTEAGAIYGEYRKSVASPGFVLFETLMNTAYDVHTYKHTTMGFEADIAAMPTMYDYSIAFFNRYYRPDNIVLVIVGDIKPEPTLAMVQKYYGAWQKGYVPPQVQPEPEQTAPRRADAKFAGRTLPIMAIAYKAPAYSATAIEPAACMLLGDLAFGETSEIYKKLVLDEQRVQYLRGGAGLNRDPGLFTITTMVKDPADRDAIEQEIYKTIAFYQANRVDDKRLADVKSSVKYGFLMGLETPGDVAGRLVDMLALTGSMDSLNQFYETLNKVTPVDIMNAANTYLTEARRTVVVVEGQS
jgi:zinc protease